MYISKIVIKNFRNLKDFNINFTPEIANHLIIIGETQSGKTNLLEALRLLIDPFSKNSITELEELDFYDTSVEINIEISLTSSLEHPLVGLLFDCCAEVRPESKEITGIFGLVAHFEKIEKVPKIGYYVGEKPEGNKPYRDTLPQDIRAAFRLGYLEPLRDVEAELKSKKNSPLRWALEKLHKTIDDTQTSKYKSGAKTLKNRLDKTLKDSHLLKTMNDEHSSLIGKRHTTTYELQTQSIEINEALKEAKVGFTLNNKQFELSRGSLGVNNALYLTLKRLTFVDKLFQKPPSSISAEEPKEIEPFTWLAIEEPEAHLHPHLQRQVYRELTKPQALFGTIVSTHSPHLVSIADPKSYVLLKRDNLGVSIPYQFKGKYDDGEEMGNITLAKLKNYLQVTRAEMVFAAGVILVEGIAERHLISAWYPELDELGISVCCIDGVDFEIYETFLKDLRIPYVIVTDWDPKQKKGEARGVQSKTTNSYCQTLRKTIPSHVFVNRKGCTLEWEILQLSKYHKCLRAIAKDIQPLVGEAKFDLVLKADTLNFKVAWKKLKIQKGIYSQELASRVRLNRELIEDNPEKFIPEYIRKAVAAIQKKVDKPVK